MHRPGNLCRAFPQEFFDLNVDLSTQVDASMWIKHMGLVNGHEDPEGIKVRALKGISGVDYLQVLPSLCHGE